MKTIFDINGFIVRTLGFSAGAWVLTAAILFALLCFCFVMTVRNGRMKPRTFWIESFWMAIWYSVLTGLGFFAWAPGGEKPIWQPAQPMWVWLVAAVVVISLFVWYFLRHRKRLADKVSATAIRRSAAGSGASKYCYALLFAGMVVSSVICGLRLGMGDSIVHLVAPMAVVVLTLLLNSLTGWRFWYLLGALLLISYYVFWMQAVLAESHFTYMPSLGMIPLALSAILPMLSLGTMKK
jgi:hypothetical protein